MRWLNSEGLSVILTTFFSYLLLSGILILLNPNSISKIFQSKTLIVMAIAYGLTNICFNWAVTNGDVVRVVFLFYLMPIWAAIFAKVFLSEDLGYKGLCRIFLALTGLIIVLDITNQFSLSININFYEILAILGGIFFAFANVFLRKAKSFSSLNRSMAIFLGSCLVPLFILLINLFLSNFGLMNSPLDNLKSLPSFNFFSIILVIITMAITLGTANFCLQFGGSKLLVQTTCLLMIVEIPVAIFSFAFFTSKITDFSIIIGGGLIVVAAIWSIFDQKHSK